MNRGSTDATKKKKSPSSPPVSSSMPRLIIIGAGFAGIQLARKIDTSLYDVLVIDKLNHHQFQPLFYQVATSQIEPSSISFPLRSILKRKKNLQIRMAEVKEIVPSEHRIETSIGSFDYDVLVIATGCKTNFFGNTEVEKNALTLKTTHEAITIRNHILEIFERILSAPEEEKEALFNLVIVGAGPTGVELAGAFAEIKEHILPKDYPGIDFSRFTIHLIEGSPNTLNAMSDNAKQASRRFIEEFGVQLRTQTYVANYDGEVLTMKNGDTIRTRTVIWSAGVTGNVIPGLDPACAAPGNRIQVDRFNEVLGHPDIYVLGDIAMMATEKYPQGHPQLANVAISQAVLLAKNLKAVRRNAPKKEYEYKDKGSMATIGTHRAVVDLPFWKMEGYVAWVIWMFLHLMLILSVRNKLIIFINWAWAYLTKDSSLRLILRPTRRI
jgi:NADH dehydrogenase